jgi:hypothetical protein
MQHNIRSDVKIPLRWDDDENRWVVDLVELGHGPLPFAVGIEDSHCPCRDTTEDGLTTQEHNDQWGRAATAVMPTGEEVSFDLVGSA